MSTAKSSSEDLGFHGHHPGESDLCVGLRLSAGKVKLHVFTYKCIKVKRNRALVLIIHYRWENMQVIVRFLFFLRKSSEPGLGLGIWTWTFSDDDLRTENRGKQKHLSSKMLWFHCYILLGKKLVTDPRVWFRCWNHNFLYFLFKS